MPAKQDEIDNVLVKQKDTIIRMINDAQYQRAESALDLLDELWFITGYDYKATELRLRLKRAREQTSTWTTEQILEHAG